MNICRNDVLQLLCDREVYWIRQKIDIQSNRKIAVFPAGHYARRFNSWLSNECGKEAEFFIDNNEKLEVVEEICSKPVKYMPWEKDQRFKDEYYLIIATSARYYHEISKQLDDVGVPYISSDAYQVAYQWERYKVNAELLYDELSKTSYLGALWYLLTYDDSLIQTIEGQYSALKMFAQPTGEIIADIGAYVGDTTEMYIKKTFGNCKIYAFEPDKKLLTALRLRVDRLQKEWALSDDTIEIIPTCVSNETGYTKFKQAGNQTNSTTYSGESGIETATTSLDNYFTDKMPPSIIKSDIEGGEMQMLRGSIGIIKNNKPKLAISIYHSPEDFTLIVEYVHSLVPEYKMAVRNHSGSHEDTVLYCWV